jgi:hypothetical protein
MATLTTSGLDAVDEHQRALCRLEDAIEREARLAETYQRSLGTQRELHAYMRLRDARRQVAAFDKWLRWVDDEDVSTAPPGEEAPLEEVLGH